MVSDASRRAMFAEETLGGVPADDMWAFLNDDGAGNVTAYSSLAEAPPPLATNFQYFAEPIGLLHPEPS